MDYESQEHYDHNMNLQAEYEAEMEANAAEAEHEIELENERQKIISQYEDEIRFFEQQIRNLQSLIEQLRNG